MGRMWSTLVLVAVLAGLGGYIYFVDSKRTSTGVADKQKVFDGVQADKIEELTLTNDGETSTLQKTDGTWKMTAPAPADADQNEVSTLTSNLANARGQSRHRRERVEPGGLRPGQTEDRDLLQGTGRSRRRTAARRKDGRRRATCTR